MHRGESNTILPTQTGVAYCDIILEHASCKLTLYYMVRMQPNMSHGSSSDDLEYDPYCSNCCGMQEEAS